MALEQFAVPLAKLEQFLHGMDPLPPFLGETLIRLDYAKVKQTIASGLGFIDPKQPYGTELFNALARLTVTVANEAVCLCPGIDNIGDRFGYEVALVQRVPDDKAYPGQWHCPGTALRPGESDQDAFDRLGRGEFFSGLTIDQYVGDWSNPSEARGHFLHRIFLCTPGRGSKVTWWPTHDLPQNTVDHHRNEIIPRAVAVLSQKR